MHPLCGEDVESVVMLKGRVRSYTLQPSEGGWYNHILSQGSERKDLPGTRGFLLV